MANRSNLILKQVQTVIVGKDEVLSRVLMAILSGGHILMEDVPGVGKTTLALAFAKTLGINFKRISSPQTACPQMLSAFQFTIRRAGR